MSPNSPGARTARSRAVTDFGGASRPLFPRASSATGSAGSESSARRPALLSRSVHRLLDATVIIAVVLLMGLSVPWWTAALMILFLQMIPTLYRLRLNMSAFDTLPLILPLGSVVAYLAVTLVDPLLTTGDALVFAAVSGVALSLSWTLMFAVTRWWRRRPDAVLHRTIILGSSGANRPLVSFLAENPQYGLRPVAVVDRENEPGASIPGVVTDQLTDNLSDLIQRHNAAVVIIGQSRYTEDYLLSVFRASLLDNARFYVVPRLPVRASDLGSEQLGLFSLSPLTRTAHRSFWWSLKRPMDILLSGLAMVGLAPLMGAIAVAVKLRSPQHPVLFRQTRVGMDGRPFELLKFRTLTPATATESDVTWNVANDHRLTRLGRFLRASSLDELPQIINVLRGDMTVVGPRPERPFFVEKFGTEFPDYLHRHRVPVGLTGWAAIHGLRGDTCIRTRAEYDNWYIEHWSLWLDLKIILLTVRAVLKGTGG